MTPPVSPNESARLEALLNYQILDTAPERDFDDLTELASFICQAPIALMSLVDDRRQWFKSKVGVDATETPREQAFCAHAIVQGKLMIVEDAALDSRFAANPLVTGEPRIRFYAGAPLMTPAGLGLGTLCVIDRQPRTLTPDQFSALDKLARIVVSQLELRRVSRDLAEAAANLKTLGGLLPICAHCKGIRDDQGYWQRVESYVQTHTDARFTHGICPTCIQQHFPDCASILATPHSSAPSRREPAKAPSFSVPSRP